MPKSFRLIVTKVRLWLARVDRDSAEEYRKHCERGGVFGPDQLARLDRNTGPLRARVLELETDLRNIR